MWRALVLVAAVALTPASGSAGSPSGIAGVVTRGPAQPVCRVGVPCSEPAAAVAVVVTRGGAVVARAVTARDGRFRLRLRPGAYVVAVARRAPIGCSAPKAAVVRTGRFTLVRLMIDSGIR